MLRQVRRSVRRTHRVVLGAFLALIVFAGSVSAECAWVLWAQGAIPAPAQFVAIARGAWPARDECETVRVAAGEPEAG